MQYRVRYRNQAGDTVSMQMLSTSKDDYIFIRIPEETCTTDILHDVIMKMREVYTDLPPIYVSTEFPKEVLFAEVSDD